MAQHKVGYIIGSLASASINRQLAKALVKLAPAELEMPEIPIRELPFYDYGLDANFPPAATAFKQAIAEVDALLFVTPEYNRSIPGALKNAIDWGSRPYGKSAFARKPAGRGLQRYRIGRVRSPLKNKRIVGQYRGVVAVEHNRFQRTGCCGRGAGSACCWRSSASTRFPSPLGCCGRGGSSPAIRARANTP